MRARPRDLAFALLIVASLASLWAVRAGAQDGTAAPESSRRPSFAEWLQAVKAEGLGRGIREDVLDQALATVEEPMTVVIERDRAQAEIVMPLEAYLARRLRLPFIRTGREKAAANSDLLEQIAARYGVPGSVVVAVWGLESNYGRFGGVRPTIAALATLAWDERRSTLFRRELFDALEMLNRDDVELANLRGSWAGAMGQVQFMPSSYLQYAEDFDGDGKRDIWHSTSDALASIANYLKGRGWMAGETWGREVTLPRAVAARIATTIERRAEGCRATRDMSAALSFREWQQLGVLGTNGKPLPATDQVARLVSGAKRQFLVYPNYDALLEYNCAHAYALSVALLSDRIAATPSAPAAGTTRKRTPKKASKASRRSAKSVQRR